MKMKDSGIEWIGQIPEDWDTCKIQSMYSVRNTKVSDIDYPPLSVTKQGVVPQLDTAAKTDDHNNRKLVKKGDFAINSRSDRRGSCGISEYDGSVSLINTVLKPNKEDCHEYYDMVFHTVLFADEFYRQGHGIVDDLWTTNWQDMKKISVPHPDTKTQEKIANYLNNACSKIDAVSADIQEQIRVLEEYKKSVISETVTKGLDKSVPMKDSGIDWIGEIPQDWIIEPVYVHFGERKHLNSFGLEQNLLSLSYGNIIRKDINTVGGLLPASFNTYNIVEANDIIIRPTDLQNDMRSLRTGLVNEHGIITSAYIALKPMSDINVRFAHYQLHVYDLMKVFYNMGNGVRQGLNYSEFSKLKLVLPRILIQNQIADYLDEQCSKIDSMIATKREQLDVLNRYKQSIIYEYVTGNKEVV